MKYANQHIENAKNFWNQSLRRAAGALGVSLLLVASASSQVATTGPFSGALRRSAECFGGKGLAPAFGGKGLAPAFGGKGLTARCTCVFGAEGTYT